MTRLEIDLMSAVPVTLLTRKEECTDVARRHPRAAGHR
jgi:hypothetical protein